jgi:hypothetical protein
MAHISDIDAAALDRLPESLAREDSVLAVSVSTAGLRIILPAGEPHDDLIAKLDFILQMPLLVDTADREQIDAAIDFHYSARNAAIDNCQPQFRFKCPKLWYDLRRTNRRDVRHCDQCGQHVFLCRTEDELKQHASRGNCVAFATEADFVETMGILEFPEDDAEV